MRTLLAALTALTVLSGATAADAARIRVVSSRADLVTGGDALVAVEGVRKPVEVTLNGRRIPFTGLVPGLRPGRNTLKAVGPDGRGARITLTNHPAGGPLLSGPQVSPWLCATAPAGLGAPLDGKCTVAAPRFDLLYRDRTSGTFEPYDAGRPPPAGRVAYVVRRERGSLTRGLYELATRWDPVARQPVWNGKQLVAFGGGCRPGHAQAAPPQHATDTVRTVLDDMALSRGFMTVTSGLLVLGHNCNTAVSAEHLAMLREHVVETYGPVRYAIGDGCSGGSIQQLHIADRYPGLLQGLRTTCSIADVWAVATIDAFDCALLNRYFNRTSPQLWASPAQRAAVTGYGLETVCLGIEGTFTRDWWDPSVGCAAPVGPDVRCTLQDYHAALLGRRPDGTANRMLDNTGVQYGLGALLRGAILPEQFVDLNERIGGWDIDARWQPRRSEADPPALPAMYRSGQILHGDGLAAVPIIDLRGNDNEDVHSDLHSDTIRRRLERTAGSSANLARWREPYPNGDASAAAELASFLVMDRWLEAVEADRSGDPPAAKVRRHRPPEAADGCRDGAQRRGEELCRAGRRDATDPRIVAGGPPTRDVLKCHLRPLRRTDHPGVSFTAAQWERLRRVFAGGVCDWSRPGVGQQPPVGPWPSFAGGPGGMPLGAEPVSRLVAPARPRGKRERRRRAARRGARARAHATAPGRS